MDSYVVRYEINTIQLREQSVHCGLCRKEIEEVEFKYVARLYMQTYLWGISSASSKKGKLIL